jgi:hypothetical protein
LDGEDLLVEVGEARLGDLALDRRRQRPAVRLGDQGGDVGVGVRRRRRNVGIELRLSRRLERLDDRLPLSRDPLVIASAQVGIGRRRGPLPPVEVRGGVALPVQRVAHLCEPFTPEPAIQHVVDGDETFREFLVRDRVALPRVDRDVRDE